MSLGTFLLFYQFVYLSRLQVYLFDYSREGRVEPDRGEVVYTSLAPWALLNKDVL